MTHIDIPFNEWSRERLRNGEKTATTRTKQYGDPGDRFDVDGRVYELTHVVEVDLQILSRHFYEVEGAESQAEFMEVWNDIHYKRGWDSNWEVYLHLFREVTNAE